MFLNFCSNNFFLLQDSVNGEWVPARGCYTLKPNSELSYFIIFNTEIVRHTLIIDIAMTYSSFLSLGYWSCRWNVGFWKQRLTVRTPASVCCVLEQGPLSSLIQSTQLLMSTR